MSDSHATNATSSPKKKGRANGTARGKSIKNMPSIHCPTKSSTSEDHLSVDGKEAPNKDTQKQIRSPRPLNCSTIISDKETKKNPYTPSRGMKKLIKNIENQQRDLENNKKSGKTKARENQSEHAMRKYTESLVNSHQNTNDVNIESQEKSRQLTLRERILDSKSHLVNNIEKQKQRTKFAPKLSTLTEKDENKSEEIEDEMENETRNVNNQTPNISDIETEEKSDDVEVIRVSPPNKDTSKITKNSPQRDSCL